MIEFFKTLYTQLDTRLAALISAGGGVFGLITMQETFSLIAVFFAMITGAFAAVKAFFEMRKAIRNDSKP